MLTFQSRLGILVLSSVLSGVLCWPAVTSAADEAMLSVRTLAGKRLVVSITYFEDGQPTRASIQGITAEGETELKLGLIEGVDVQVATATAADVQLTLAVGENEITASSEGGKNARLKFGDVAADWKPSAIDVTPNSVDRAVWKQWHDFVTTEDLRAFRIAQSSVPDAADFVTFDLPCLRSFLSVLQTQLGSVTAGDNDGRADWIAWDLSGGQRVVSAALPFQRGSITFEITHIGNAITDIRFESPQIEGIWFSGPAELDAYTSITVSLLEDLFAGNALAGWERFGPAYRGTVTVEQLSQLSKSLVDQFGKLDSIETKYTRLLPADYETNQQTLVVVSALKVGAKQCLAETKFVFDVSPSSVPAGQLASVFVRPTWATAQPAHHQAAVNLLVTVFENGSFRLPKTVASDLVDQESLSDRFSEICQIVGPAATTDFDLWRSSGSQDYTRADGTLTLASKEAADVRLEYVGAEVAGVTVVTSADAVSTLSCIRQADGFASVAEQFWKSLLGDDTETAYELLSSEMKANQSVDVLRFSVATSGFVAATAFEPSSVRLATHPDRSSAGTVSVYTVVILEDGTKHPLRCDLERSGDSIQVVGFETDIEQAFPVPAGETQRRLVEQFVSGNVDAVDSLVADEQRIELDRDVLASFLRKLNTEIGQWQLAPNLRLVHHYSSGSRSEVLSGRLTNGDDEAPFQLKTRLGKLHAFNFHHESLRDFLPAGFIDSSVRKRSIVFVGAWFSSPAQRDDLLRKVLDHDLAQEGSLDEFGSLRKYLLRRYGAFEDVVVERVSTEVASQTATVVCKVMATKEDYKLAITFTWNATSIRISAVEVIR